MDLQLGRKGSTRATRPQSRSPARGLSHNYNPPSSTLRKTRPTFLPQTAIPRGPQAEGAPCVRGLHAAATKTHAEPTYHGAGNSNPAAGNHGSSAASGCVTCDARNAKCPTVRCCSVSECWFRKTC